MLKAVYYTARFTRHTKCSLDTSFQMVTAVLAAKVTFSWGGGRSQLCPHLSSVLVPLPPRGKEKDFTSAHNGES